MIPFRPITFSDREMIRRYVYDTECRNCDLNFLNLMSWEFLYHTEMAEFKGLLLFRFLSEGQFAYLVPVGNGDWKEVLEDMIADAAQRGYPFILRGVCENSMNRLCCLNEERFVAESDRDFSDYLYWRESLVSLAGKKLQPKRNLYNRFIKNYPDYEYLPLTPDGFDECLHLEQSWRAQKVDADFEMAMNAERRSLHFVFQHWEELGAEGGLIRVDGKVVAFTYGAPINYDTYGVCLEKADTSYEGAFAAINKEFVSRIPENYTFVNREEDLGLEGLRKAKLAYQPVVILQKYTVRLAPTHS